MGVQVCVGVQVVCGCEDVCVGLQVWYGCDGCVGCAGVCISV